MNLADSMKYFLRVFPTDQFKFTLMLKGSYLNKLNHTTLSEHLEYKCTINTKTFEIEVIDGNNK